MTDNSWGTGKPDEPSDRDGVPAPSDGHPTSPRDGDRPAEPAAPPPGGIPTSPPYGPSSAPPGNPTQPRFPTPPGAGAPPGYSAPPPGYGVPPGYPIPPGTPPPGFQAEMTDPLVSVDFAGWWSRGFALLKAVWRPVALVQLAWVTPVLIVMIAVQLSFMDQLNDAAASMDRLNDAAASTQRGVTGNIDLGDVFIPFLVLIPALLVAGLGGLVASGATYQLMIQKVTGQPVSIGAALTASLRRVPALLGWGILAGFAVMLGFICCILPGFYVAAVVSILTAVVMVERGVGLGRCFQLFNTDLGTSISRIATIAGLGFGVNVVSSIVTSIVAAISGGTGGFFAQGQVTAASIILQAAVTCLFSVVTGTLFPPLLLTAYADMRARTEPFSTAYLLPTATTAPTSPTW